MMIKSAMLVVAVWLVLSGCGEQIEPGRSEGQQEAVSGLQTIVVEQAPAIAGRFLAGTIVSSDRAIVTARIAGQVARPLVEKGAVVKAGQALLELTGETVRADLKAARAGVAESRSQREEARLNAELADKNFARFAGLFEKGALTALEYDRIVADKATAHERLAAAESAMVAAQARQAGATTMAELATMTAPYAATVVDILVDAGTTVHPGTPLLILDRSGPWQVEFELPESLAGNYRIGDAFPVEIPALAVQTTAQLAEILPTVNPRTRSVSAKLVIATEAPLQGGLYAKVAAPQAPGEQRIMIPVAALVVRGQLTSVYVVEDQVLKYRLVRTGQEADEQVEILSGLQPGELIVVAGLDLARHGTLLETAQ